MDGSEVGATIPTPRSWTDIPLGPEGLTPPASYAPDPLLAEALDAVEGLRSKVEALEKRLAALESRLGAVEKALRVQG